MSLVLALKYRPHRFEDVIGQDAIIQTLSLALDSKRLSHAYLFSGLRGSGKTSTARIFAKSLLCEQGPTSKPCETCSNCKGANENAHIDIIEMDAASNRKIDDIRELIEHTKYKPNIAKFKIFIIDEVHMLTREAFNALLKTLEEPPEYVKFILATTDPLKLPATILSRTQHFRFKKISLNDVTHHLQHILNLEQIEYEIAALEMCARSGNGSLRDTLTLLDQAIIYSKGKVDTVTTANMLGIVDPSYLKEIFDTVFAKDREKLLKIVKDLETYESETIIDELIAYIKERFFENDPKFSILITDRFFKILSESKSLLFLNSDSGFVLTMLFFKMVEALKLKSIDDVISELESNSTTSSIQIPSTAQPHAAVPPQTTQQPLSQEKDPFTLLIEKLYDRQYALGECFEENVTFIRFAEGTLTWESCADGECKNVLRNSYAIIKQFVKDIYGVETKISMQPCSKSEETLKKKEPLTPEIPQTTTPHPTPPEELQQPSSCVGKSVQEGMKDYNVEEMLNAPMVEKAKELFQPTQIVVKRKV
jgi:DNA polymerase-3 subunit gamma/tau